jgi:para-nitrobenzyl esterase
MSDDTVRIEGGWVSGSRGAEGAVRAYRGIPYAAPPVGKLRWRPPQPVPGWPGVLQANAYAPQCPQPVRPVDSLYAEYAGTQSTSEDCLYLNIWAPGAASDGPWPVMVWLHGGGFQLGSGANPSFACGNLPLQGVVLVTCNYRLGPFGFLAHPALSDESPRATSGNYGLLDMAAALRWVSRNIAAFGGDPNNITAFGSSSGAHGIVDLMASPVVGRLFDRAILHSSGLAEMPTLEEAERAGMAYASLAGASGLADLRSLPTARLLAAAVDHRDTFFPIRDGWLLPESVHAVFAAGRQQRLPLMAGWTSGEGTIGAGLSDATALDAMLQQRFGIHAAEAARRYRVEDYGDARAACAALQSDIQHAAQVYLAARAQAAIGAPTYVFHFDHPQPFFRRQRYAESAGYADAVALGAFHSSDYPYVFGSLDVLQRDWTDADRQLVVQMQAYWTSFARNGEPSAPCLPAWPQFDERHPTVMRLSAEPRLIALPRLEHLHFIEWTRRA